MAWRSSGGFICMLPPPTLAGTSFRLLRWSAWLIPPSGFGGVTEHTQDAWRERRHAPVREKRL